MVKFSITGAALAALLSFGSVVAQEGVSQQPTVAARIADAKLKEARGELAAAEAVLRQALAQATGDEQQQVKEQLATLLERQGKTREAAQLLGVVMTENIDPLDEEVMLLDRDLMSETVDVAKKELGKLGPLAVPALLKALPRFGPFGLTNALELLASQDDPRIGPALAKVAEAADPSVAAMLAQKLSSLRSSVALPLARRFAEPQQPVLVQLGALQLLLRDERNVPATKELALRLAADPTGVAQWPLFRLLEKYEVPYRVELFDVLRSHGSPELRAQATGTWLLARQDLSEAAALDALAQLPKGAALPAAVDLVAAHRDWLQVAFSALRSVDRIDDRTVDVVAGAEWWRSPDESARLLLQLPAEGLEFKNAQFNALMGMAEHGWPLPAELDASIAGLAATAGDGNGSALSQLVRALPADDEARALAVWKTLDSDRQAQFARAAVTYERPWHRLVAQQLLAASTAREVSYDLLKRDWNGAGPEVSAMLTGLAQRWPEDPAGGQLPWHQALVSAYARCNDLPAAVVLPLALHGREAWLALVARDPRELLAYLIGKELPRSVYGQDIGMLLDRGGSRADVPLALQALSMVDENKSTFTDLKKFLVTFGGGNLDVIRLGLHGKGGRVEIATEAARSARIEDLSALLSMLPDLPPSCAVALCGALAAQVRASHAETLVQAADALLARSWTVPDANPSVLGKAGALEQVLILLQYSGDRRARELAQRILARTDLTEQLQRTAAITAITVAGSDQRAFVLDLLASKQMEVVRIAVTADVLRDDPQVQQRRREAVLRIGDQWRGVQGAFDAFDAAGAVALAEAVLASDRFPTYCGDLAGGAVRILGRLKDPGRIPQFVAAARHPVALVRAEAAYALGNTFAREAAPQLIEMLKDDEDIVRKNAQHALDEIANYLDAKAKWEQRLK